MIFSMDARAALLRSISHGRHRLPFAESVRGGLICAAPAVLAAAWHEPLLCWSAIAAFWTCLCDDSGTRPRQRMTQGLVFAVLGALAAGCAIAAGAVPGLAVALAGVSAWLGALVRCRGALPGLRGLLAATAFAVCAAFPVHGAQAALDYAVFFLGGGLWAIACNLALWQYSADTRVRAATFAWLYALGSYVSKLAQTPDLRHGAAASRAELRTALDAMSAAITAAPGEVAPGCRRWLADAEQAMALLAGIESLLHSRRRAPQPAVERATLDLIAATLKRLAEGIDACALDVRRATPPDPATTAARLRPFADYAAHVEHAGHAELARSQVEAEALAADAPRDARAWRDAFMTLSARLATLVAEADSETRGATHGAPASATRTSRPWRDAFAAVIAQVRTQGVFARYAARLALAAMVAVTLARWRSAEQGYWLALTTMFIVQPTFSQTVRVSSLRIGGTMLGAVLASALALLIHSPILLALAILPLATGTLAARAVSYVSYILFLTSHFVLVAHLGTPVGEPWDLAVSRVLNSLAGVAVGVAASFLAWPEWEQHKLAPAASRALACVSDYVQAVLRGHAPDHEAQAQEAIEKAEKSEASDSDTRAIAALRRQACLAVDALEAVIAATRLESLSSNHRAAHASVLMLRLRKLVGVVSPLEGADAALDAADRARLAALAQSVSALLRATREERASLRAHLQAEAEAEPTGSARSFFARHIEHEVIEGALAVSMVLPDVLD
ncbi:putative membrane protein YccC [Paraburkholderia unamae]|uniref:FUSC family protein n=1 Tax=Paraburkholderia unamae TaxID=219649 RepID=UPI000DC42873|nr:FUSC family protein [Paraburkholderia unamae]RAR50728.1 putative membrane protein YccC [Paraburkholderia unamae]